jgi:oxygen-independent coproporphyrinogen-3 oxidase
LTLDGAKCRSPKELSGIIANAMPISAYIHIPFCSHKCDFCDFAAFAGLNHLENEYCATVMHEMETRLKRDPLKEELVSIFFGGGTPGLIDPKNIAALKNKLLSHATISPDAEIELETTPHSITLEKAKAWLELGVSRLSIGVESFNDNELKAIGRDHTRAQALTGIETAIAAGFKNINCDFMYSLPTQTLSSWRQTLDEILNLAEDNAEIKHISAYSLHLANNSPLFSRFPKESVSYPDDEIYESMYLELTEQTEKNGFLQYEVSNFSKPGFQSKHNMAYWNHNPYVAFGVGSHRYYKEIRSSNWRSLSRYMKDPLGDETIMLGLRMRSGIQLDTFTSKYGFDLLQKHSSTVKKLVDGGLMHLTEGYLAITTKGVPVSNSIIAEFF